MRRIHEIGERHLEHISHLAGIGLQLKTRPDQRHHGRDDERRACDIGGQGSQHLDMLRGQGNFFLRFTQRGMYRILIGVIGATARKRDLARMGGQIGRPLSQ